ncbi:LysE family translocator [Inquilinus limosus]|uniref:Lysine transporter LysE n=1 Tax=Inquilinus limosus TaxID=171674 RepID=A0A211ZGZ3_9PROT|nr:LysE family translocator [Inquilinus limosus]OWJ64548.1 lysine transporter LysE [Inquilinus limosus]
MSLDLWFAFLLAAFIVLIIPGPTVTLVLSYALGRGRSHAWWIVAGVALGDLTAMTLSLLGLGALLAASAGAFTVLKWIGAAYLVYLGVKLWRAAPTADGLVAPGAERSPRAMLLHAFAVTALNPKSIVFFVAFLPQFVHPEAPLLPQMAVLEGTFVTLAALNAAAYAWIGARLRDTIGRPSVLRLINRAGAGVLVAAGFATAAWNRAT